MSIQVCPIWTKTVKQGEKSEQVNLRKQRERESRQRKRQRERDRQRKRQRVREIIKTIRSDKTKRKTIPKKKNMRNMEYINFKHL